MSKVLLHACCGPCATYPVEQLRHQGNQVSALWYNPNVHLFQEHQLRLEAMRSFAQDVDLPLLIPEGYDFMGYLRAVVGKEDERCLHCFRMRLTRTAEIARENGFDAFTTTLLISPYQKHELLRQVGEEVAAETGIRFLYEDWRPGYNQSRKLSQEHNLYRQKYCGCIYSEWERYSKANKKVKEKQR